MSIAPRHVVAALVAAFIVGTVGGGLLAAGSDDPVADSRIGFNPDADPAAEQVAAREPKPEPAIGEFTADAVVEPSGRIVITGVADGAKPGTPLGVQRKESGGWTDFPADTRTGGDGSYSVWLKTSRTGKNTFRVMDQRSGEASNPVTVRL